MTDTSPIIVTAPERSAPLEKASAWQKAESDNVIVYSDGDTKQLARVTRNLEKLHTLLARLYRSPGRAEEPAPLVVVLFGSSGAMRDLGLRTVDYGDGPYGRSFMSQRYYDPRPDGSILALSRADQIIEMNTNKARSADCEDFAHLGADCVGMKPVYHPSLVRSWEALLYGAYAQHLLLNYAPGAYPRWYMDGIGALFSTVVFRSDGSIDYGRPPPGGYGLVFRSYGLLDTANVLNGDYLHNASKRMTWTPYHAAFLTHYFVLADIKAEVRAQFAAYMAAVARGEPLAKAVEAFGTMTKLRYDVLSYIGRNKPYARTATGKAEPAPVITPLSEASAAALMARLVSTPAPRMDR
ncbi:hypothetical protein [Sphingomonas prati]|uniref:Uncharacterized protein n=1 Tax=Sphingomonas prati TaxID=1843237 RepID=A0A7W9BPE6_9SPHN|nr:hypothetical protein [Sphingomonas prati]MBB5727570.1 hypothetical protein [Sphingomonas prati]GGE79031.1 hypothetical protein GCM10011404_09620 [Sphingomonas prati]